MKLWNIQYNVAVAFTLVSVTAIVVACSSPSSEAPKKSSSNSNTAALPSIPPLGTPQISIDPSASISPSAPNQACWDQLLKSPAAVACTTMFAYSSQTCVSGVTKQASCTRDDINKVYGSSQLNGKPAMTQVDAWISGGYTDMQCAIGSDQKLYVYFLKKTFSAGATADVKSTYTFEEQTLGPPGPVLDSIKLNPAGSAPASCG